MRNERSRGAIADEAVEWFVTNQEGPADALQRDQFMAWLESSPLHVQEYLSVSLLSVDLQRTAANADLTLQEALAQARSLDETLEQPLKSRWSEPSGRSGQYAFGARSIRWMAAAAVVIAAMGASLWWAVEQTPQQPTPLHYATRHGEQVTERLADDSVVRLDTDSAIAVRYSGTQRLVELERGQVLIQVAHERERPFIVMAGFAEAVAHGTTFNVYRRHESTLVTVVEGEVAVRLPAGRPGTSAGVGRSVLLHTGEQIEVAQGSLPASAAPTDVRRQTAWLRREIVFQAEPLANVVSEFNRYGATRIDIDSPDLRSLRVTGVFSADDTETFIAFLKSLEGVKVQVTPTRIVVSRR
jgi:transmembrane sensor